MTLKEHLLRRIRVDGPLSVAEYMSTCLLHPSLGYYTTQTPFGAEGDFITAPDISQMFGELIGLCFAQGWLDQGRPAPVSLVELGPGRGTLMADLLRAARQVPGFVENAQIHLVEASARLRALQKEQLAGYDLHYVESASQLPQQPTFVVANEFFDALPIRQFQKGGTGWRERQIGCDGDALVFGLAPEAQNPLLAARSHAQEGHVVETRPQADPVMAELSGRIEAHGGLGLIIDYGDWSSLGDTLQAVRGHAAVSPLDTPGQADLTAHVDFEALAKASSCGYSKLTPQGLFLERLGITHRANSLARNLSGEALDRHVAAHRRLTHPDEMGNLFKVLGLFPKGAQPPAGVEM